MLMNCPKVGTVLLTACSALLVLAAPAAAGDAGAGGAGVASEEPGEGVKAVRSLLPPVTVPLAATLATSGQDAAVAAFRRMAAAAPAELEISRAARRNSGAQSRAP